MPETSEMFKKSCKTSTLYDQITVLITRTVFMTKCPLDTGLFDTNTHTRGASRAREIFQKTFSKWNFQKDKQNIIFRGYF